MSQTLFDSLSKLDIKEKKAMTGEELKEYNRKYCRIYYHVKKYNKKNGTNINVKEYLRMMEQKDEEE